MSNSKVILECLMKGLACESEKELWDTVKDFELEPLILFIARSLKDHGYTLNHIKED